MSLKATGLHVTAEGHSESDSEDCKLRRSLKSGNSRPKPALNRVAIDQRRGAGYEIAQA